MPFFYVDLLGLGFPTTCKEFRAYFLHVNARHHRPRSDRDRRKACIMDGEPVSLTIVGQSTMSR